MGECYICTIETNELSKCKCKNLFLHLECQLKLLDRRDDIKCSICLEEYRNINVNIVEKKTISDKGKLLLSIIIAEIVGIGTVIFESCILLNMIYNDKNYGENLNEREEVLILSVIIFFLIGIIIGIKTIYILMKYIIINKAFFDIENKKIIKIKSEEDINRIL